MDASPYIIIHEDEEDTKTSISSDYSLQGAGKFLLLNAKDQSSTSEENAKQDAKSDIYEYFIKNVPPPTSSILAESFQSRCIQQFTVRYFCPWSDEDMMVIDEKFGIKMHIYSPIYHFLYRYNYTEPQQVFHPINDAFTAKSTDFILTKTLRPAREWSSERKYCQISDPTLFSGLLAHAPNLPWTVEEIFLLKNTSFTTKDIQRITRAELIYKLSVPLDLLEPAFRQSFSEHASVKTLNFTIFERPPGVIRNADKFILCSSVLSPTNELNFYPRANGATAITVSKNFSHIDPVTNSTYLPYYSHLAMATLNAPKRASLFKGNNPEDLCSRALVENYCLGFDENKLYLEFLRLLRIIEDSALKGRVFNAILRKIYSEIQKHSKELYLESPFELETNVPQLGCFLSGFSSRLFWNPQDSISTLQNTQYKRSSNMSRLYEYFIKDVPPFVYYSPSEPDRPSKLEFGDLLSTLSMVPWSLEETQVIGKKFGLTPEFHINRFLKTYGGKKVSLFYMFYPSGNKNNFTESDFIIAPLQNHTETLPSNLKYCHVSDVELFSRFLAYAPHVSWKVDKIHMWKNTSASTKLVKELDRAELIYSLSIRPYELPGIFNIGSILEHPLDTIELTVIETSPSPIQNQKLILCSSVLSLTNELNFYPSINAMPVTVSRNFSQIEQPIENSVALGYYVHLVEFFESAHSASEKSGLWRGGSPAVFCLQAFVENYCQRLGKHRYLKYLQLLRYIEDPKLNMRIFDIALRNIYTQMRKSSDDLLENFFRPKNTLTFSNRSSLQNQLFWDPRDNLPLYQNKYERVEFMNDLYEHFINETSFLYNTLKISSLNGTPSPNETSLFNETSFLNKTSLFNETSFLNETFLFNEISLNGISSLNEISVIYGASSLYNTPGDGASTKLEIIYGSLCRALGIAPWPEENVDIIKEKYGISSQFEQSLWLKQYPADKINSTKMFINYDPNFIKNLHFILPPQPSQHNLFNSDVKYCHVSDAKLFIEVLASAPDTSWKVDNVFLLKNPSVTASTKLLRKPWESDLVYEISIGVDELDRTFQKSSLVDVSIKRLEFTVLEIPTSTPIVNEEFILCSSVLAPNNELIFYRSVAEAPVIFSKDFSYAESPTNFLNLAYYAHLLDFSIKTANESYKKPFLRANYPKEVLIQALIKHYRFEFENRSHHYYLHLLRLVDDPRLNTWIFDTLLKNIYYDMMVSNGLQSVSKEISTMLQRLGHVFPRPSSNLTLALEEPELYKVAEPQSLVQNYIVNSQSNSTVNSQSNSTVNSQSNSTANNSSLILTRYDSNLVSELKKDNLHELPQMQALVQGHRQNSHSQDILETLRTGWILLGLLGVVGVVGVIFLCVYFFRKINSKSTRKPHPNDPNNIFEMEYINLYEAPLEEDLLD